MHFKCLKVFLPQENPFYILCGKKTLNNVGKNCFGHNI